MPTLLHIDSSPMGAVSVSRELSQYFTEQWLEGRNGGSVIRRDLAGTFLKPVDGAWVSAVYTPASERSAEQRDLLSLSDQFVAELKQADEYVIGVSFHNFNIPSVLKLWLDLLYRAGETYDYVDGKPQGLLIGKKATVIMASGGVYTNDSRLASLDHATPYLKTMFGIFGVTDLTFIQAGGTKRLRHGEVERDVFMEPFRTTIDKHLIGISSSA